MLTSEGYTVSYDVDTLREGHFDKQILERIEQCHDFILVVDKSCFVRTIDPATNPLDDWLWQALAYAMRIRRNIIPVLMDNAAFPNGLPKDIENVKNINGLTCVQEHFDTFYEKLKSMLHAYPRNAHSKFVGPSLTASKCSNLKLKADMDCLFYLDGEKCARLKAGIRQKFPLPHGEYELMFVSEECNADCLVLEFEMADIDKLQKVNLSEIKKIRLQKAAKDRIIKVGNMEFKMIQVKGGAFTMGDISEQESEAESDEKTTHSVTLGDYYIGKYEITVAQFRAFINETGYQTDADKNGGSYIWNGSKWELKDGVNWRCGADGRTRSTSEDNHPVIHVSWNVMPRRFTNGFHEKQVRPSVCPRRLSGSMRREAAVRAGATSTAEATA